MPFYQTEALLTEDLRIKVTPALRQWIKVRALRERRSLNNVVRTILEDALEAEEALKAEQGLQEPTG